VFGLWKGDLTLKRAIVSGLESLERDGEVAKIIARYIGDARVTSLAQDQLP
jgi:polar amino acid transport system substrate-binding protein/cystine transport system substrate-binding protein/membrane-bound lytic murein transglycosylase F